MFINSNNTTNNTIMSTNNMISRDSQYPFDQQLGRLRHRPSEHQHQHHPHHQSTSRFNIIYPSTESQQAHSQQHRQLCINFQPLSDHSSDSVHRLTGSSGGQKIRNSSDSEPNYVNLSIGDYIVFKPTEASSLYKCVNHITSQVHLCKIVETKRYHDYLSIYIKLEDNPGINKIHEICVDTKYTIIVFEKSYGDLHSYIRSKKRLTESETRKLFYQITSIVADCHAKGIILRDIKLRKFIFKDHEQTQLLLETWDDAVILLDPRNDFLNDKHGCPTYVSPEILSKSTSCYSGRSADCWSLGVILFTMLAGRYPFHDPNPTQLFTKIRRGAYQIPTGVSPSAEFIIRSLLRKQPTERLTAHDLLHARWFKEKEAYLEPDDLPEARLLESEDTEDDQLYQQPITYLSSPSPSSSSSPFPQTQPNSPNRSTSNLNTPPPNNSHRLPSSNQPYALSSNGSSTNEPKPLTRMISSDQYVPDITLPINSDEPFHWSLTSGLLS